MFLQLLKGFYLHINIIFKDWLVIQKEKLTIIKTPEN